MKLLVAVSGGVDSVALLDMLVREKAHEITVAHFEHGIRGKESRKDQRFVETLAVAYGLPFVTANAELGMDVSEAEARRARYDFLRDEADRIGATIATAHHADDVIETIAINLIRGTGWRGLAVMDSDIYRPLLHATKSELIAYAHQHRLAWREDSTNQTDAYLRNRLRKKLTQVDDDTKRQLLALRDTQAQSKRMIDEIIAATIANTAKFERAIFNGLDAMVADELLRAYCLAQFNVAPPRPARARMLEAIRTYTTGKVHQSTDMIDIVVDKRFVYLKQRG